ELAEYINTPGLNRPAFYNDDDDDDVDYTITITPVLSTEEPDNSLSMGDEHLDTIPTTKSDEVIKFSVENLVLILSEFEVMTTLSTMRTSIEYVEASPHDSELVSLEVVEIVISEDEEIEDDNLRENLLNVNLLIAKIEALKDNPPLSSKFLTKSSSISPKSFLEETNTFHNFLPEFESFCFDLEEISSGMAVPLLILIFLFLEYDSFTIDLSNDQFPPTDRSDFTHKEFADELAHIISPPEYDCFYFRNLPDPGEWISILHSGIRENPSSTTRMNLPVEDDHSPLLAYVVWIFLAYLTYPVIPPYLHSFGNEDTIFDPGTVINCFYSFKPAKTDKSSIDEPPEVKLKDIPPHLEYVFLEGYDKLPVIIAKDLSDEEKIALITVLKSHKRAVAWKLSVIKGINPEFCTHKIQMEDDFEPAVQHQRRVNLKIHDVIKKEVLKLLDVGLIYPISDSPWVIPVHCVPQKGGFTVVENEENELISTRLVTRWRVCIDYQKLNEATRKYHFPLPFMDQMLERLAGNEYYCFLDGFSGYF
nr:reverse transcriptase domain-containing protein [Tanacetum cinerariifolium]